MREVGEQRAVEGDAVDAPLVQAVRGHLHRHRTRAGRPELARAGDAPRARRAWCCRSEFKPGRKARCPAFRSPPFSFPSKTKACGKPLRAGGLAVGAGDAADPHRLRGAAVELVREQTRLRPEALHARVRHAPAAKAASQAKPSLSQRTAAQPRSIACAMWRRPSPAAPGQAKNAAPGAGAPAVGGQAFDRRPLGARVARARSQSGALLRLVALAGQLDRRRAARRRARPSGAARPA